jgi:hypothetical protein
MIAEDLFAPRPRERIGQVAPRRSMLLAVSVVAPVSGLDGKAALLATVFGRERGRHRASGERCVANRLAASPCRA